MFVIKLIYFSGWPFWATRILATTLLANTTFGNPVSYFQPTFLLVKCDNERLLYLKFMNTTSGKISFEYAACRLWNRLPHHVRTLNDSEQFKNNIKTILFTNTHRINDTFTLYN